jgi:hypothetical protein
MVPDTRETGREKGMASTGDTLNRANRIDWRLRISFTLTVGWLVLGLIYISTVVGWTDFARQAAPSLGGFLEGAFAPLAFLWLVVGFFLQQQQLHENTNTIREQLVLMQRSAEQAEIQSRAISADELHSRQDTFLRVSELVADQLGMVGGMLLTSYLEDPEQVGELWTRTTRGESHAFSLDIMRRCLTGEIDAATLFYGTQIRSNHTGRFLSAFDRLVEAGEDCDNRGMIADALRDGAHGRVARLMREVAPR